MKPLYSTYSPPIEYQYVAVDAQSKSIKTYDTSFFGVLKKSHNRRPVYRTPNFHFPTIAFLQIL